MALAALGAGVLPSLPHFLVKITVLEGAHFPPFLLRLYDYACFTGFGLAIVVYIVLRKVALNR